MFRKFRNTKCRKKNTRAAQVISELGFYCQYFSIMSCLDSVRAFKEKMKLGRFADQSVEDAKKREIEEQEAADAISVGARCEVTLNQGVKRRGTVMFVGQLINTN